MGITLGTVVILSVVITKKKNHLGLFQDRKIESGEPAVSASLNVARIEANTLEAQSPKVSGIRDEWEGMWLFLWYGKEERHREFGQILFLSTHPW